MKKTIIRIVALVLTVMLACACLTACGDNKVNKELLTLGKYEAERDSQDTVISGIVAQNERFALEWNGEDKKVVFHDLKNNTTFSTVPQQIAQSSPVDENGMPIKNNPRVESAISVTYYDELSASEQTLYSYNAAVKNGKVYTEAIKNGIRVIYDFSEKEITVPVDYTVGDEAFKISVQTSQITEGDKFVVTGVAIAPFICGIKNDTDDGSYLFFPDGSGTVIVPKTIDTVGIHGSIPVYGGDRSKLSDEFEGYTEQCYMSVYGVKNGNSGLCAIIDSSSERAFMNYSIGSSNIKYSSVYPFFRIKSYNVIDSPLKSVAKNVMTFNENITDEPLSVSFYPIYGENCGYNDMAKIYRNHLKKTYDLKKRDNEKLRLTLELEGAFQSKKFFCGVPYTGLTRLTSVKQAREIAEYFSSVGDGLLVRMCGFSENGLDAGKVGGGFRISSELGSKKDITELTQYCKANKITLSLDFDPISFSKRSNGYSPIKSAARFSDGQLSFLNTYNNVTGAPSGKRIYLISRSLIPEVTNRLGEKVSDYGFDAIGLGRLGSFIYSDFLDPKAYNCDSIQEDTIRQIKALSKDKAVVLTGANDYAVGACDYVTGVPVSSTGIDFKTYDVPFYSMVLKGYVSMSSKAVNLAADTDAYLLSCIEAGVSPAYTLIYNFSKDAVLSEYAVTRSSEFTSIRENILEKYNETKAFFDAVASAEIIEHRVIKNDLRAVKYNNGVTVYVNYGDSDAEADGIKISAKDYMMTGV